MAIPLNLDGSIYLAMCGRAAKVVRCRTGWETDNAKFEREFEKVVQALRSDDGVRQIPPPSRL
jgi:hypothetical protein